MTVEEIIARIARSKSALEADPKTLENLSRQVIALIESADRRHMVQRGRDRLPMIQAKN